MVGDVPLRYPRGDDSSGPKGRQMRQVIAEAVVVAAVVIAGFSLWWWATS
jgi:hypothetical protein